jgi:hypothetical protein
MTSSHDDPSINSERLEYFGITFAKPTSLTSQLQRQPTPSDPISVQIPEPSRSISPRRRKERSEDEDYLNRLSISEFPLPSQRTHSRRDRTALKRLPSQDLHQNRTFLKSLNPNLAEQALNNTINEELVDLETGSRTTPKRSSCKAANRLPGSKEIPIPEDKLLVTFRSRFKGKKDLRFFLQTCICFLLLLIPFVTFAACSSISKQKHPSLWHFSKAFSHDYFWNFLRLSGLLPIFIFVRLFFYQICKAKSFALASICLFLLLWLQFANALIVIHSRPFEDDTGKYPQLKDNTIPGNLTITNSTSLKEIHK